MAGVKDIMENRKEKPEPEDIKSYWRYFLNKEAGKSIPPFSKAQRGEFNRGIKKMESMDLSLDDQKSLIGYVISNWNEIREVKDINNLEDIPNIRQFFYSINDFCTMWGNNKYGKGDSITITSIDDLV